MESLTVPECRARSKPGGDLSLFLGGDAKCGDLEDLCFLVFFLSRERSLESEEEKISIGQYTFIYYKKALKNVSLGFTFAITMFFILLCFTST